MKFTWDITEEEFEQLKDVFQNRNWDFEGREFAICNVGRIAISIVPLDKSEFFEEYKPGEDLSFYINTFILGVDSRYGHTESGTPYDLGEDCHDYSLFPFDGSFEAFKSSVITDLERICQEKEDWKEWAEDEEHGWEEEEKKEG